MSRPKGAVSTVPVPMSKLVAQLGTTYKGNIPVSRAFLKELRNQGIKFPGVRLDPVVEDSATPSLSVTKKTTRQNASKAKTTTRTAKG